VRILISNDDGCWSPGIEVLAEELARVSDIDVVAPDRDRSGASNSLTLEQPLRVNNRSAGIRCVDGTPTDCVHLAITGLLEHEPDMVVSGINLGPNLGDDVLYSGTVAAAMEGRFLGYPAMAVSMATFQPAHLKTGARVARLLVERIQSSPLPSDTILNVNVPDLPWESLRGWIATRLGYRHKAVPVVKQTDPRGRPIYWVGPPGAEQDAGEGTDFHAVRSGHVSVTPIQVDLTRHAYLESLSGWLEPIS
jgi:5'-nucleotidase